MADNSRVLILALDSAEPTLLRRWADTGELPTIRALMKRGATARLNNPPGLSGATWPTLHTGVNPARHGHYYYTQLKPGSYSTEILSRPKVKPRPFWSLLSNSGKRVAIVDVPKICPQQDIDALQIVDWCNHDGDIFDGFLTWPPELKADIDNRFGPDLFDHRSFGIRGPRDFSRFVTGLCENVERKTRLVQWQLQRESWDLLYAAWDDAHWAGHFGWRQHDPQHPHHDEELAAAMGDPLKKVLQRLDACFGEILEMVAPDIHVLLLSSHGMGPGYRTREVLDPILRHLEGQPTTTRETAYGSLRSVWDALPNRFHRPLTWLKDGVRERLMFKDRARRPYFALPSNNDGGLIRLNVAGREPQGKIQPGEEYEATCDWLCKELKAIVDADTGQPIVREVFRPHQLMSGEQQEILPDLAVEWLPGPRARRISSPRIGELEVPLSPFRSGEHLPEGLVISAGRGVAPGTDHLQLRAEDFAPTVTQLLGLAMADADGQAAAGLLPRGAA